MSFFFIITVHFSPENFPCWKPVPSILAKRFFPKTQCEPNRKNGKGGEFKQSENKITKCRKYVKVYSHRSKQRVRLIEYKTPKRGLSIQSESGEKEKKKKEFSYFKRFWLRHIFSPRLLYTAQSWNLKREKGAFLGSSPLAPVYKHLVLSLLPKTMTRKRAISSFHPHPLASLLYLLLDFNRGFESDGVSEII